MSWITTKQAAEIVGVSKAAIIYHVKKGNFHARYASQVERKTINCHAGRCLLILESDVIAYKEESKPYEVTK